MQNDNKIAELTKNHFEDFIESYQTRFEGNLQKYLSDYRRETEIFLSKKEEVLNEIFLDKKSESLNSFETTVASKMSQELTEFHRQMNHAKNTILSDIQSDQVKLLNDFSIQVKKFSNENKQTLGDYFVSEKSKFIYELGKGKDKFKRDLELVSVDVLEQSLEKIHDQIGKQRELARGELDSLKIFKAKEFAQELDELLKKQNVQFRSEVDISLQYILNSFESDLKERVDEISNKTQVNLQQISNEIRNDFQGFSKRRLEELREDFEEIASDISKEVRVQTNKSLNSDFEEMVAQLVKEKNDFTEFATSKNQAVKESIESKATELNDEIVKRMRHLVERGVEEMKTEIEAKEKSHREGFEGSLSSFSEAREKQFEKEVINKIKSAEEIFSTKSTLKSEELLTSLNKEFTVFVNSKMNNSQETLLEESNKKLQLLNKEIRAEFSKCEVQSKSDFTKFSESKMNSSLNEIQSRSEKILLRMENFLNEKQEILSEASIDLLQEAKREILKEYKECHNHYNQMLQELEGGQLESIRSQSCETIENSLADLNRQTQEYVEAKMVDLREIISDKTSKFNEMIEQIVSKFEGEVQTKVGDYQKQLKTESQSAHQAFRESLKLEVGTMLDEAQKDCHQILGKQVSKFENHSQKRASFVLGELNKKVEEIKKGFQQIQAKEEEKVKKSISAFTDECIENKIVDFNSKVILASDEKFKQYKNFINKESRKKAGEFQENIKSLCKENKEAIKQEVRTAEIEIAKKAGEYRDQNLNVYRQKTQELSKRVVEENENSARALLNSFNERCHQTMDAHNKAQVELFNREVQLIQNDNIAQTKVESVKVIKETIERGEGHINDVFKKKRQRYSAEVEKEIEKFGFKLDSIGKYLTNNFQKSFEAKLGELNGLGNEEVAIYKAKVKKIGTEAINQVNRELKKQVHAELSATFRQVKSTNKKMLEDINKAAMETSTKAKQKVYNDCVVEAKKVLGRLQELSQQVYSNQLNRHQHLMADYNKKIAHLERLLNSNNIEMSSQRRPKSSIRPPQLPVV
jgi:hypothetical protein